MCDNKQDCPDGDDEESCVTKSPDVCPAKGTASGLKYICQFNFSLQ